LKAKAAKKAALVTLVALMLLSAFVNGVCLTRLTVTQSRPGDGPRLVTLDVCGKGAFSISPSGTETLCGASVDPPGYFPSISFATPYPDVPVASADPGDTEKPPEA